MSLSAPLRPPPHVNTYVAPQMLAMRHIVFPLPQKLDEESGTHVRRRAGSSMSGLSGSMGNLSTTASPEPQVACVMASTAPPCCMAVQCHPAAACRRLGHLGMRHICCSDAVGHFAVADGRQHHCWCIEGAELGCRRQVIQNRTLRHCAVLRYASRLSMCLGSAAVLHRFVFWHRRRAAEDRGMPFGPVQVARGVQIHCAQ
jgi:hypothetical protein